MVKKDEDNSGKAVFPVFNKSASHRSTKVKIDLPL